MVDRSNFTRSRSRAVSNSSKSSRDLMEILEDDFFQLKTAITNEVTRGHYRRAVRWLGELLGRSARVADLSDDNLARLLRWLQEIRGQGPATANTSHKNLCALWRWLHNRGVVATGPTVAALRTPERAPRAWREDELAKLLNAARTSPGSIGGLPARVWWLALFALEWDTGCRASELLALRWEWLDWERGWLTVPAEYRKGQRRDGVYGLLPDTLGYLGQIRRPTGLILGWDRDRSRYWQLWKGLLDRAGLPNDRRTKTQCLRRTFATYLQIGGGDASAACGHSSPSITREHYLDPTLTTRRHGEAMPFRLLGMGGTG